MDFEAIEKQAKSFREQGQNFEAISLLESQLTVHKELVDSEEYKKTMIELCDIYNDLASELLSSNDPQGALALLRKAESIKISSLSRVKTLNTLACYYRQIGKVRIAESYLLKALNIQTDYPNTHLNLCAVLSELGKHEEAMVQAMQAVILMQDLLIAFKKNPDLQVDDSLMPIAYLNLGVQLEYLKRFDEAIGFYKRAESFSQRLDGKHPVRGNAENAVKQLSKKILEGDKKIEKKNSIREESKKIEKKTEKKVAKVEEDIDKKNDRKFVKVEEGKKTEKKNLKNEEEKKGKNKEEKKKGKEDKTGKKDEKVGQKEEKTGKKDEKTGQKDEGIGKKDENTEKKEEANSNHVNEIDRVDNTKKIEETEKKSELKDQESLQKDISVLEEKVLDDAEKVSDDKIESKEGSEIKDPLEVESEAKPDNNS